MSQYVQPGWYPNPSGDQSTQRYWDGQQWTEQYVWWNGAAWVEPARPQAPMTQHHQAHAAHAAHAANPQNHEAAGDAALAVPAGPGPHQPVKQPRRWWPWMVGTAAVALVALVVVTINFWLGDSGPDGELVALSEDGSGQPFAIEALVDEDIRGVTTSKIVYTDERAGYDYTRPIVGIKDRTQQVEFEGEFDPRVGPDADPDVRDETTWAFRMFADRGLTLPIPAFVNRTFDDRPITISPYESAYATAANDGYLETEVEDDIRIRTNASFTGVEDSVGHEHRTEWGLRDTYYLVRYVDESGELLERPVVSQLSFEHELATPSMSFGVDPDAPGMLKFTWDPVPGATHYRVVSSSWGTGGSYTRDMVAVARTEETSWSAASQDEDVLWVRHQNKGLAVGTVYELHQDEYNLGTEYGVIAFNDSGEMSALGSQIASSSLAASLPYEIDRGLYLSAVAQSDCVPTEDDPCVLADLTTEFPYLTLGGQEVTTSSYVVEVRFFPADDTYKAGVVGTGTRLGMWRTLETTSEEEALALAEEYNQAAAPQDGLSTGGVWVSDHREVMGIEEPTYEVDPVLLEQVDGSNNLVEFIAAHMIQGTTAIDMTEMLDFWGRSAIDDAAYEAMYQNGDSLALAVYLDPDGVLHVRYNETDRVQESRDEAARVVAEVINEGMSDREKVTALNNYLVRTVEYDYAAYEAANEGANWLEYSAWDISGALLDGTAVCQGYAMAFDVLAGLAGVESVVVTGYVHEVGELHAWNKVKVDGEWLALDPTWNVHGNDFLMIRDDQFVSYASRGEDNAWVVDQYIDDYATP